MGYKLCNIFVKNLITRVLSIRYLVLYWYLITYVIWGLSISTLQNFTVLSDYNR